MSVSPPQDQFIVVLGLQYAVDAYPVTGWHAAISAVVRVVMGCLVSSTGLAYTDTALIAKVTAIWRASNMVGVKNWEDQGSSSYQTDGCPSSLFKGSNKKHVRPGIS
jgi:hypothetical protein